MSPVKAMELYDIVEPDGRLISSPCPGPTVSSSLMTFVGPTCMLNIPRVAVVENFPLNIKRLLKLLKSTWGWRGRVVAVRFLGVAMLHRGARTPFQEDTRRPPRPLHSRTRGSWPRRPRLSNPIPMRRHSCPKPSLPGRQDQWTRPT